jgi:hypothetical protein
MLNLARTMNDVIEEMTVTDNACPLEDGVLLRRLARHGTRQECGTPHRVAHARPRARRSARSLCTLRSAVLAGLRRVLTRTVPRAPLRRVRCAPGAGPTHANVVINSSPGCASCCARGPHAGACTSHGKHVRFNTSLPHVPPALAGVLDGDAWATLLADLRAVGAHTPSIAAKMQSCLTCTVRRARAGTVGRRVVVHAHAHTGHMRTSIAGCKPARTASFTSPPRCPPAAGGTRGCRAVAPASHARRQHLTRRHYVYVWLHDSSPTPPLLPPAAQRSAAARARRTR